MLLGQIQLENFNALTKMPQKAASAWASVEGLCGATLKPVLFVGTQQVSGINYWFIAEENLITLGTPRRLVTVAINESLDGEYRLVVDSIASVIS